MMMVMRVLSLFMVMIVRMLASRSRAYHTIKLTLQHSACSLPSPALPPPPPHLSFPEWHWQKLRTNHVSFLKLTLLVWKFFDFLVTPPRDISFFLIYIKFLLGDISALSTSPFVPKAVVFGRLRRSVLAWGSFHCDCHHHCICHHLSFSQVSLSNIIAFVFVIIALSYPWIFHWPKLSQRQRW